MILFVSLDATRPRHPTTMEGVSFAGAEHSTPVPLKPPTQLSTPTPRRQSRKTAPPSTSKKAEGSKKGTPAGIKNHGALTTASKPGRPVKSLPGKRKDMLAATSAVVVHFLDAEDKTLREIPSNRKLTRVSCLYAYAELLFFAELPGDLESLKLLLAEALDLRYTQEMQLEHERTPGFFIPVIDGKAIFPFPRHHSPAHILALSPQPLITVDCWNGWLQLLPHRTSEPSSTIKQKAHQ